MTSEEFTAALEREVLDSNLGDHQKMLAMDPKAIRDPLWKEIATGYASMNDQQRSATEKLARLVAVDTISTLLGILDGGTLLRQHRGDFELSYNGTKLNGDLQDLWLEAIES